MKLLTISILVLTMMIVGSCKKDGCTDKTANNFDEKAKNDDGTCTYDMGTITFWISTGSNGTVAIDVDNVNQGTVTEFYGVNPPADCENADGCVTATLKTGYHTYTATGSAFGSWSGSFTLVKDECMFEFVD